MMNMEKPKVIAIVGPTASGKTALSVEVAKSFGGEVISADSMQIYKGMDIASAKPTEAETTAEIEILKGDVNYDGRVNEIDITLIQNHLAYLRKLEKYDLQVADFDSSGIVNVKDITQIQVRIK